MEQIEIPEFIEFKKIPRLSREIVITEKIDGTNGCIYIGENGEFLVGSRSRWITPDNDNHGFARWAYLNKDSLMNLGPGRHYGEWWGKGIQRGYNLPDKSFSLFNVYRWCEFNKEPKRIPQEDPRVEEYQDILPRCCSLVPVLGEGIFNTELVNVCLNRLRIAGSFAAPGFMKPEGVVIYHRAGNLLFKKTIEKDEVPKTQIKKNLTKKEEV